MIKTKKQNKNANSKAEEKTEKTIKKSKDDVSKVKKLKGPKTAALVEAAAELVEASELPIATPSKKDKKPKKEEVVVEESSSHIADESENEEEDDQIADDSDEEVSEDKTDEKPKSKPVGYGRIIYVGKFPTTYNRSKLASLFSSYGKILSILFSSHTNKIYFNNKIKTNRAYIVFDDLKAASQALELNGKVIDNQALMVRNPERKGIFKALESIIVSNLKLSVTEDQIREVLAHSSKIELIKIWRCPESNTATAFVELINTEEVGSTLKHSGTLLDGQAIQVDSIDLEKTVFVGGLNNSTTEDGLRNVFSSCGEIAFVVIKHLKNGYVIFKDTESVEKALKLDGTSIDDASIKVKKYQIIKPKKSFKYLGKKPNAGGKYLGKKPNAGGKYLGKKPYDPNFRKIKDAGNKKPFKKVEA